jgi:hypothetical protein
MLGPIVAASIVAATIARRGACGRCRDPAGCRMLSPKLLKQVSPGCRTASAVAFALMVSAPVCAPALAAAAAATDATKTPASTTDSTTPTAVRTSRCTARMPSVMDCLVLSCLFVCCWGFAFSTRVHAFAESKQVTVRNAAAAPPQLPCPRLHDKARPDRDRPYDAASCRSSAERGFGVNVSLRPNDGLSPSRCVKRARRPSLAVVITHRRGAAAAAERRFRAYSIPAARRPAHAGTQRTAQEGGSLASRPVVSCRLRFFPIAVGRKLTGLSAYRPSVRIAHPLISRKELSTPRARCTDRWTKRRAARGIVDDDPYGSRYSWKLFVVLAVVDRKLGRKLLCDHAPGRVVDFGSVPLAQVIMRTIARPDDCRPGTAP